MLLLLESIKKLTYTHTLVSCVQNIYLTTSLLKRLFMKLHAIILFNFCLIANSLHTAYDEDPRVGTLLDDFTIFLHAASDRLATAQADHVVHDRILEDNFTTYKEAVEEKLAAEYTTCAQNTDLIVSYYAPANHSTSQAIKRAKDKLARNYAANNRIFTTAKLTAARDCAAAEGALARKLLAADLDAHTIIPAFYSSISLPLFSAIINDPSTNNSTRNNSFDFAIYEVNLNSARHIRNKSLGYAAAKNTRRSLPELMSARAIKTKLNREAAAANLRELAASGFDISSLESASLDFDLPPPAYIAPIALPYPLHAKIPVHFSDHQKSARATIPAQGPDRRHLFFKSFEEEKEFKENIQG